MVDAVFVQFRDERRGELDDSFNIVRVARTPALDVVQGLCESNVQRVPVADLHKAGQPPAAPSAGPECASVAAAWAGRLPGAEGALPAGLAPGDGSGTGGLRCGLVALPDVTVARLTQAQLGGSGVFGNFAANLGLGAGSTVTLFMELSDLQQLQVEDDVAWEILIALVRGDSAARPLSILSLLAQRAPTELARVCRGQEPRRGSAKVSIATRILYAVDTHSNFARSDEFVARVALDAAAAVISNQHQPRRTPELGSSGALAGAPTNLDGLRAQLEALSGALAGGPTDAAPVGEVMRHCWQVAGTLQGVEPNSAAPPQWCAAGEGRYVRPAGWTGGSDALHGWLCAFVATRDTITARLDTRGARSFRHLGGEPLPTYFMPGREPFTGVARGS